MDELLAKLHEMYLNASYDGNSIPEAEALDMAITCVKGVQRIKNALDDAELSDGEVCDVMYGVLKEIDDVVKGVSGKDGT